VINKKTEREGKKESEEKDGERTLTTMLVT